MAVLVLLCVLFVALLGAEATMDVPPEGLSTVSVSAESAEAALSPELDDADFEVPAGTVLCLPGRRFPLNFSAGEFIVGGHPLRINEVPNAGLGTGLIVWDGSIVLAKYLEHARVPLEGHDVLELGSGTGVIGFAAKALGARSVTMTDLYYTLENLRSSVALNEAAGWMAPGSVLVRELDWFAPEKFLAAGAVAPSSRQRPPHIMLAADVIWVESLIPPLVKTIRTLLNAAAPPLAAATSSAGGAAAARLPESPQPFLLLAHQTRSRASDQLFFTLAEAVGLAWKSIPREAHHPDFSDDKINIFTITLSVATPSSTGAP